MELKRSDLELIISAMWMDGNEQERIAKNVDNPGRYMEMARYFWNFSVLRLNWLKAPWNERASSVPTG